MVEQSKSETPEQTGRKPRRGDVLEVLTSGYDRRGHSLADSSGMQVRLPHVVPGSRVRTEVIKRRGARIDARVLEIVAEGPGAVEPRCQHFGTCGGCSFQNLDYARQLEVMHERITGALTEVAEGVEVQPVIGCDPPWAYRGKMDFTFGNRRWIEEGEPEGVERDFALGLHVPGRFDKVLDVEHCDLMFDPGNAILTTVRRLVRERGLSLWDVYEHTGLMRHLLMRKAFATGEILIALVTNEEPAESAGEVESLAAELCSLHPEITTCVQLVNTSVAAVAVGRERVLSGPGFVREIVHGLEFRISAGSFFQINPRQTDLLFDLVREYAEVEPNDVVYDLYCGAGSFALHLARSCRSVIGIEEVDTAVQDARDNARRNDISNVEFIHGDVAAELSERRRKFFNRPRPDVCIVDPPRAGLHPSVPPALLELGARRIVYVSCNPESTAGDLLVLEQAYEVTRVQPVDLFPHTPHIECVFLLTLRD